MGEALREFDILGPLSKGTTLLEASAGTGKTWSITGLLLRLVAEEGVSLSEVVVVTFTRAATAELRERIRVRFAEAEAALRRGSAEGDPLLTSLIDGARRAADRGDPPWLERIVAARASLDLCQVSTIHGFAQRLLQQHALECGLEPGLELLVDPQPLVAELVGDWLVQELHGADEGRYQFLVQACGFTPGELGALAHLALSEPDAPVFPAQGAPISGLVDALRDAWDPKAVSASLAQAKKAGLFVKGQRTFGGKGSDSRIAEIQRWLDEGAALEGLRDALLPLSARALKAKLAEGVDAQGAFPWLAALEGALEADTLRPAAERARFARWVRATYAARKRSRGLLDYHDLLRELAERLEPGADPEVRAALLGALRTRYKVALIDEFQDTDALQWTLFHEAFGGPDRWLYLIGDPKQAIYAFRGADIRVYLQARASAGDQAWTMRRNFRSDRRAVVASNALMDQDGFFGDVGFSYVSVDTPDRAPEDRLVPPAGWEGHQPLQLRAVDQRLLGGEPGPLVSKGAVDGPLAARVASDVVELLEQGLRLHQGGELRPLRPGDVAVLVRSNRQAALAHRALQRLGVPAVIASDASVLASEEAGAVADWLEAMIRPSFEVVLRRAATSRLFGWSAAELEALEEGRVASVERWEGFALRLRASREQLRRHGVLRALRDTLDRERVAERLLCQPGGERRLTDLLHLGELLQEAQVRDGLGEIGLARWLERARVGQGGGAEDVQLRLEHDEAAVQVLTVHKSKGLEFPVVLVPWMWDQPELRLSQEGRLLGRSGLLLPDPSGSLSRELWLHLPEDRVEQANLLAREEGMRLLYVALTRARFRTVLYVGHAPALGHSPVGAALFGEGPDRLRGLDKDDLLDLGELLEPLAGVEGVGVTWAHAPTARRWRRAEGDLPTPDALVTAPWSRSSVSSGDRVWSYSTLARSAQAGHADPERPGADRDAVEEQAAGEPVDGLPLGAMPAGEQLGTCLHEILEDLDLTSALEDPLAPSLRGRVEELLQAHGLSRGLTDAAAEGLRLALCTPLGGPLRALRLADLPTARTLRELRFDLALPLVRTASLVEAVWPDPERRPILGPQAGAVLRGALTGSVDLIFIAEVEGEPRWFVADYKSNRVAGRGEVPALSHFSQGSLAEEMRAHLYDLQLHLYTLALHRYLRWRLGGAYDYDRHMGGAYYLFLRGMVGPDAPTEGDLRSGCYYYRPERAVIEALDRALEGADVG